MKKKKSIFLYDPDGLDTIFILASVKKLGFQIWTLERLWELIITDYSPIFIISDKIFRNFPDILVYIGLPNNNIGGLINSTDIQKTDPNPDIQLVLTELKKNSMLKNTKDIRLPDTWGKNSIAARYGKALPTAKIFLKNKHQTERLINIINEAITEINEGKQSYNISMYEDNHARCLSVLAEVRAKVKTKNSPVKIGNKKITYAYLDNISVWLDLEKLQRDLVILHPFITIIQYRLDNREYTWVGSSTVNVNLIFNIIRSKNPYSTTLKGSHKKIINLLLAEAKSLSQ